MEVSFGDNAYTCYLNLVTVLQVLNVGPDLSDYAQQICAILCISYQGKLTGLRESGNL